MCSIEFHIEELAPQDRISTGGTPEPTDPGKRSRGAGISLLTHDPMQKAELSMSSRESALVKENLRPNLILWLYYARWSLSRASPPTRRIRSTSKKRRRTNHLSRFLPGYLTISFFIQCPIPVSVFRTGLLKSVCMGHLPFTQKILSNYCAHLPQSVTLEF